MKGFYYGAWHHVMELGWPARFLIELIFAALLCTLIVSLLRSLGRKKFLKKLFLGIFVWSATELLYLAGRHKEWAIAVEERVFAWKERKMDAVPRYKKSRKREWIILLCLVYLAAIAADFPFIQALNAPYRNTLQGVRAFFQQGEQLLSKGYEEYQPLFSIKKEAADDQTVEDKEIYLLLNERGQGGSYIRTNPSLDADAVGVTDQNDRILFLRETFHDGERYWLKVCLVEKDLTGWISGNLVEEELLRSIVAGVDLSG